MAAITLSNLTHFLKAQFKPGTPQELVLEATQSPLYQLIPKNTQLGGEYLKIPITYGLLPSGSVTFSTAQANSGTLAATAFKIDVDGATPSDYTTVDIAGQVFRGSNVDKFAFFKQISGHIEAALRTQARRRAMMVYRSYRGYIGTIHASTTLTGTTLQWAQRGEVRCIDKGNKISFADSSFAARDSGKALTINAAGRTANPTTCTMSANLNTVTAIAVGDYIHFEGDLSGWPYGLMDIVPESDPTAGDSFHGVDRSADPWRLAGGRLDCSAKDSLSGLIEGIHLMGEEGQMDLSAFVPPETYHELVELIRASTVYNAERIERPARMEGGDSQKVSVKGLRIDGPDGVVDVYRDIFCPPTTGWVGELDRLTLMSMGEDPGILEEDGNMILRKATTDSYEVRVGGYPQMACDGPGRWMRLFNYGP